MIGNKKKIMVIGLDCAEPSLVFDRWREKLPNLSRLMRNGRWGPMRSTDPPITVPAWTSMMTSKDPGRLGIYGFRNRKDYSYDGMDFANSAKALEPTVWDILSKNNLRSVVIGVPLTYPPKPLIGSMITCFLTPSTLNPYTYPPQLRDRIEKWVDRYMLDVDEFRTEDKDRLLGDIYAMTERRFTVARHLRDEEDWDFFMMVEMGVDRIHHGFWKYMDPSHPKYEPGSPWENSIRDYYIYLDSEIGKLIEPLGDETAIMVVSDHGAQGMEGGICVNEWLIRHGYLSLLGAPEAPASPHKIGINWSRTAAWGEGGYYSRIFLNVLGREPEGIIDPGDYERIRDEIKAGLEAIEDEHGKNIGTVAFKPEELYPVRNNIPPDLIVYFGDLRWRSVGTVGWNRIQIHENDTGPDDANHSKYGIFVLFDPARPQENRLKEISIYDVAPTILRRMEIEIPTNMIGKPVDSSI